MTCHRFNTVVRIPSDNNAPGGGFIVVCSDPPCYRRWMSQREYSGRHFFVHCSIRLGLISKLEISAYTGRSWECYGIHLRVRNQCNEWAMYLGFRHSAYKLRSVMWSVIWIWSIDFRWSIKSFWFSPFSGELIYLEPFKPCAEIPHLSWWERIFLEKRLVFS